MAFTRNWLKEQLQGYLKDQTVGAYLDTWIDLGAKRVSQVLECWEMEQELFNALTIPTDSGLDGGFADSTSLIVVDGGDAFNDDPLSAPREYIVMPDRMIRIIAVQVQDDGEWRNLRSIPKHSAYSFKAVGLPSSYIVERQRIYPLPFMEGEFRAIFLVEVEIPVGDNETPALTSYPFVFLNAALAEAYDWKQDAEMNARYEQKWIQEASQVRDIYRSEHVGDTPSVRAV